MFGDTRWGNQCEIMSPASKSTRSGARGPSKHRRRLSYLRLFNQLAKLGLLRRGEVVFDADEKHELGSLDFVLRGQNLVQLQSGLLLVYLGLFEQRDQAFHLILQGPLKLGEFQLRLANLNFEIILLLLAESDGLLVLHDGLRWEQHVAQGIFRRLLRGERTEKQPCKHYRFHLGLSWVAGRARISGSPSLGV